MNWKGHLALGMVIFGVMYFGFVMLDSGFAYGLYQNAIISVPMLFIAIPVGLYASIVPDTDIRTSKAYAVTIILIIAIVWILLILGKIDSLMGLLALSVVVIALLIPSHRGFTHSLIFGMLFGIGMALLFVDWRIGVFTFGCCMSHLIGDR